MHQTGLAGTQGTREKFAGAVATGSLPVVAAGRGLITHAQGRLRRNGPAGAPIRVGARCRVSQPAATFTAIAEFETAGAAGPLAIVPTLPGKGSHWYTEGESEQKCSQQYRPETALGRHNREDSQWPQLALLIGKQGSARRFWSGRGVSGFTLFHRFLTAVPPIKRKALLRHYRNLHFVIPAQTRMRSKYFTNADQTCLLVQGRNRWH